MSSKFFLKKATNKQNTIISVPRKSLEFTPRRVHQLITFESTKLYSQQSTPQVNRRSMISMTLADDCQLAFDKNIKNRFSSERHNHCKRVDNIEITVPHLFWRIRLFQANFFYRRCHKISYITNRACDDPAVLWRGRWIHKPWLGVFVPGQA